MADNNPTQAEAQAQPYEIFTMNDGTKFKLPPNLTDEQAMSRIAQAYPDYAERAGIRYDLERDYDFTTGLPDIGTRWDMALTMGNTQEAANVLNEKVGKGNWGLYNGQPYVTPDGLRQLGIEDKTNRNRMLNGRGLDLYDFVDYAPDIAAAAVSTAAALVTAPAGGVGGAATGGALRALLSRGLIASSARAGLGDAAARVGIQGVQELTGKNEETFGEIAAQAGMSGLITTVASIGLGAPLEAVARTAKIGAAAASRLPAAQRGVNPALDLQATFEARDNIAKYIGEPDANLLTLASMLKSDQFPSMMRTGISQAEGLGMQATKSDVAKNLSEIIEKLRAVTLKADEITVKPGAAEEEITNILKQKKAVYDAALTKDEQAILQKTFNDIQSWDATPVGKLDNANATVRGFKDNVSETLSRQIKANMDIFDNADHYGSKVFKDAKQVQLTDQKAVNALNKLIGKAQDGKFELTATEVMDILPSNIKGLISGRGIAPNVENTFFRVRPVPKLKKGMTQEAVAKATMKSPPAITVGDLMEAERLMRLRASSVADRAVKAKLLDTSVKLQSAIETTGGVSKQFSHKLNEVNKKYRDFYSTFYGDRKFKNGLVDYLLNSNKNDPGAMLKELYTGKNNKEFTTFIDKLYKAFPDTEDGLAKAANTGSMTADEIMGNLGLSYIRNRQASLKRIDGDPKTFIKEAKRILNEMTSFENTVKGQFIGKEAKGAEVWNKMFSQENMKNFKETLSKLVKGDEDALKVVRNNVLDFKQAEGIVSSLTKAAGSLERNSIRSSAEALRNLASVEPQFKDMYQTLFVSEVWSELLRAQGIADPMARMNFVSNWAKRWNESMAAGNKDLLEELSGTRFKLINDMALVMAGKTEFARGAGSISANTQVTSLIHKIIQGSVSGALKPLVYMYAVRNMAPGTPAWNAAYKYIEKVARTGQAPDPNVFMGTATPQIKQAIAKAQQAANFAMRGKNGFAGSAIASYLQESALSLPSEDEAPRVPVTKRFVPDDRMLTDPAGLKREQEDAAVGQQQAAQQFGVALSNLLKANTTAKDASPYAGVGTVGLQQGMKIGRGA
jgi:hypothetical protein